jgi:DNA-binding transcriptional ArsR family regulator
MSNDPMMSGIGTPTAGDFGPLFAPPAPAPNSRARRARRPSAETSIGPFHSRDRSGDLAAVLSLITEQSRTLDEIACIMGKTPNAISGRITSLADAGLIEDSGERRPTRTGAKARVWRAVTPS